MTDIVTLEDGLRPDGKYCVHLMSNAPIEWKLPNDVVPERGIEAGAHVLRAEWRFRGPCEIVCPELDWERIVVLWALERDERISEQAIEAAELFYRSFGVYPTDLRLAKLPMNVEWGTIVTLPNGQELVTTEADYVPAGFLTVDNTTDVF